MSLDHFSVRWEGNTLVIPKSSGPGAGILDGMMEGARKKMHAIVPNPVDASIACAELGGRPCALPLINGDPVNS